MEPVILAVPLCCIGYFETREAVADRIGVAVVAHGVLSACVVCITRLIWYVDKCLPIVGFDGPDVLASIAIWV
jgi:hypothetical protein